MNCFHPYSPTSNIASGYSITPGMWYHSNRMALLAISSLVTDVEGGFAASYKQGEFSSFIGGASFEIKFCVIKFIPIIIRDITKILHVMCVLECNNFIVFRNYFIGFSFITVTIISVSRRSFSVLRWITIHEYWFSIACHQYSFLQNSYKEWPCCRDESVRVLILKSDCIFDDGQIAKR